MSTSTTAPKRPSSQTSPEVGHDDRFIEERLDKTRVQVKLIDLIGALMVLVTAVLGVLLVLAVIDHWIVSLGVLGRWLAALLLLLGVVGYSVAILIPLAFGRINPAYAARAIEKGEPALKNSLINFLMFRSDRAGVRAAVYQGLKRQAATDLSHVQVETAVDRAKVIKIGYVLAGVLALCALYTILSPKSTFQTGARAIAPWADVARPSRVRIENVQPGDREIFYGETVNVSADCYDMYENEPVTLFFSTLDSRVSSKSVVMRPSESGLRYQCVLLSGEQGIQQDLIYWIEAGDARTEPHRITVLPAPTILVERVEYEYPAYTNRSKKTVERQGDIKGPEGTRVTVRARANQPIGSAVIELAPTATALEPAETGANTEALSQSDRLEMEFDGDRAWCSFVLELDPSRTSPKHSFYHIRFVTGDGGRNPHPILHRIEVTRDLSPEVEILTPTRDRIEVREDGGQKIEIRAVDPDYGLSKIALRAVAGGHDLLDRALLSDSAGQSGQVVVVYDFKPSEHGLRAGDAAAYWALAEDNRTSPATSTPAPNVSRTRTYHITVLPPEKKPAADEEQPSEADPTPSGPSSRPSMPEEPGEPDSSLADEGEPDAQEGEGQDGEVNEGQSGSEGNQSGDESSGSDSADAGMTGDGSQGTGGSQNGESESGTGSAGQGTQQSSDGSDSSSPTDASGSTGGSGDSSGSSTDGTQTGESAAGATSESGTGGGTGEKSQAGSTDATSGQPSPASAREEPLHDGEVFETAMEHMQQGREGNPTGQNSKGQGEGQSQTGEASSDSQSQNGSDGTKQQDDATTGSQSQEDSGSAGRQGKPKQGASGSSNGGDQQQKPSAQPNGMSPGASSAGEQKKDADGQQKSGGEQTGMNQSAGRQKRSSSGQSGKPRGGSEPSRKQQSSSSSSGKPKDSGQGEKGESGGGQNSKDQSGTAGSQQKSQKQPKKGSSGGKPKPGSQSPAPKPGERPSNASGDESGDRSGAGKQGAGQGAQQPGNDSAGSSSPGDDGQAVSDETGKGEESSRPGDTSVSREKTGSSGMQKGYGSKTDSTPGSQGEGGATGDRPQGEQPEKNSGTPTPGPVDTRGQGLPLGGGMPSTADLRGFDMTGEVPPGEKPNVEYAKKATDLVLEYLKDQQQDPDRELLDKLGWTKEQMQEFVARWDALKRAAVEEERGSRKLDEALRSLGLRPRRGTTRDVETRDDESRGLQDAGGYSSPPPRYAEQFNAYKKGTARTGGN